MPPIKASENVISAVTARLIPDKEINPHSLLALIIKCSPCRKTHRIIQCFIGFCSGLVPKGKSLQNPSKYGQLPATAKQQLAIATPFELKTTCNDQT